MAERQRRELGEDAAPDFFVLDSREIRETIREKVYARLRRAIVEGHFAPGERLIQDRLAQQLGVSRSPVRDAIRRLESEGLVEVAPVRGVTVINMPPDEAVGLYDLREVLEGLAARLAARNISSEKLSELRSCVKRMGDLLPPKTKPHKWVEENSRFHEIIVEASGNRKLMELLPVLRESIGVLCRTIESNPGRVAEAMREHEDILAAIACGDAEESERLGRLHIVRSKNAVLARLTGEARAGAVGRPNLRA
ncbi:MAG: GntR family transcriptional regulator [Firmicutes bacterium]|jgi:DNA-binding GntR family transcriptional regulator|nr:GntR family transcriptional regulator [Bacillota bacterium]MDH7495236.1 GntR family transcriptional regulator [Bacillota bacterium]